MNLRDLRYLVAVADLRSFNQAAEQCFISQPTLSMQIKKMEESLGVVIFERNNKKVLPTELGQHIIASARRILLEVDCINQLAHNAQNPLAGNFRLGAFPTLATYIFPDLIPLIREALPALRLILVEEKTDELLRQLTTGVLDAALLALPIESDSLLETKVLFEDEFMLAVAPGHPFATYECISQADLFHQKLLLLDEGHCLRGQALQFCRLHHAEEQEDVRATGLETLRQMVRAGTGITFIPKIAIREQEAGICYVPFANPAPKRTIGLVWRKTSSRAQVLAILSDIFTANSCAA